MYQVVAFLICACCLCACNNGAPQKSAEKSALVVPTKKKDGKALDAKLHPDLVDIQQSHSQIQIELKYTTSANFLGEKLYSKIDKAYLQKDVAARLARVQKALQQTHPGYQLLIYDALRPVTVQQKMWDALDSLPPVERGKFVSNPKNRSLHNMGAAVDLTILDQNGVPLDMGAGYDDIRQIAYPSMEKQFVAEGKLMVVHMENRDLLRNVMKSQGFRQLQTEWWHFNACSRAEGLLKYKVLLEEP